LEGRPAYVRRCSTNQP